MCFDEDLHAVGGDLRQESSDSGLASRMQVGLRVLHEEQTPDLRPQGRNDNRKRVGHAETGVRGARLHSA